MEKITSPSNPKVKEMMTVKDGKNSYFVVEGKHQAEMALDSGRAIYLLSSIPYEADVPVYECDYKIIKKIASSVTPEGVLAYCKKSEPKPVSGEKVLFLDGVRDPGNLGTLLRTALAFGYYDVVLPKGCASAYSDKALASSQGAIFALNIIEGKETEEALKALKEQGYLIVSSDLRGNPLKEQAKLNEKFVLVLGNEAHGVSKATKDLADLSIRIEMSGIDSLNVAVAGAVLMYIL